MQASKAFTLGIQNPIDSTYTQSTDRNEAEYFCNQFQGYIAVAAPLSNFDGKVHEAA